MPMEFYGQELNWGLEFNGVQMNHVEIIPVFNMNQGFHTNQVFNPFNMYQGVNMYQGLNMNQGVNMNQGLNMNRGLNMNQGFNQTQTSNLDLFTAIWNGNQNNVNRTILQGANIHVANLSMQGYTLD